MTEFNDAMRLSKEAMKAQDGKKVPLTMEPGGPIIGEATLEYNPDTRALHAQIKVTEPWVAEFLTADPPSVIFKKES